jgi:K+-sensing histidine kinase KdpD
MPRRLSPRVGRWLSGLLASVAMVAVLTGVIAILEPHLPDLALLVLYLLAVLPVAIVWGARLAVLTSLLSVVAFAVLLPPRGSLWVDDSRSLVALAVFLVTSIVVAELAARSRRAALVSAPLGEEQSALRRVATLVAQAVPPASVIEAVTREVGLLSPAPISPGWSVTSRTRP